MGRVKKKRTEIWSYPRPGEPSEGPLTSGEFFGVQPDLWASSEEGGPAEMLGCWALSPHLEPHIPPVLRLTSKSSHRQPGSWQLLPCDSNAL